MGKRGMKPIGLRVKFGENVGTFTDHHAVSFKKWTAGAWFIWVRMKAKWFAIHDLPFMRERDAIRGMQSLTAAGLDTYAKLSKADVRQVKQVACEHLQW